MADHGDGYGDDSATTNGLDDSVGDEGPEVVGDGAEYGANSEQGHRRDVDGAVAVDIGEFADEGHATGVAEEIAGDDPGDLAEVVDAQAEVAHDTG